MTGGHVTSSHVTLHGATDRVAGRGPSHNLTHSGIAGECTSEAEQLLLTS